MGTPNLQDRGLTLHFSTPFTSCIGLRLGVEYERGVQAVISVRFVVGSMTVYPKLVKVSIVFPVFQLFPVLLMVIMSNGEEWMNPTEAAEYLGISRQSLYKLMDSGALPFQSVTGIQKRRIRKEDLDALVKGTTADTTREKKRRRAVFTQTARK